MADTGKLYLTWAFMLLRCRDKHHPFFKDYGGRGIGACARWADPDGGLAAFAGDMGDRPPRHTLDRIDNARGYDCGRCPDCEARGAVPNCRWATRKQQLRNMRTNRMITHDGQTRCLAEWAELVGMSTNLLYMRLRSGLTFEEAVARPIRMEGKLTAFGLTATLAEHCQKHRKDLNTVRYRLAQGWSPEDALAIPAHGRLPTALMVTAFGETKKLTDFCRERGMAVETVRERLQRGWVPERALSEAPDTAKGRSKEVQAFGRRWSVKALAAAYNVPRSTVQKKMADGMTPEEAVAFAAKRRDRDKSP